MTTWYIMAGIALFVLLRNSILLGRIEMSITAMAIGVPPKVIQKHRRGKLDEN